LILPFSAGRRRAWLHAEGVVLAETESDEGWQIDLRWSARQASNFRAL